MFEKTKKAVKKFIGEETGVTLDSMSQTGETVADVIEDQRPLTLEEQRFAQRCAVRSAGGQKILNLLSRGTRVSNSVHANLRLGQAYSLY